MNRMVIAGTALAFLVAGCHGHVAHGSTFSSDPWGPHECHPYTGANPSRQDANNVYQESILEAHPGMSRDSIPSIGFIPSHDSLYNVSYEQLAPGSVAWETGDICFVQAIPDTAGQAPPWNQVQLVSNAIIKLLANCNQGQGSPRFAPGADSPDPIGDVRQFNSMMHACPQVFNKDDQDKFWKWSATQKIPGGLYTG